MACYLRHLAMAAVGGGWMTDYDVVSVEQGLQVPPPPSFLWPAVADMQCAENNTCLLLLQTFPTTTTTTTGPVGLTCLRKTLQQGRFHHPSGGWLYVLV